MSATPAPVPTQAPRTALAPALSTALLEWFSRERRDLPWRRARNPYRVWVAEIMLQQTQVATVIPYFTAWMRRFPDLPSLASAPLDEVLKAWEGLGYYRRARLLHRAAGEVTARGARLPQTSGELRQLPGVGAYTAAAIASLAFGERVLAVDGNVRRVAARLFMVPGRVSEGAVRAVLEPFLPETGAGDFNEALMDLGALVCGPRPHCERCPLTAHCAAYRSGRVSEFPEARPRRPVPLVRRFALVHRRGAQVWLYRRGESEMLGGLWGFALSEAPPPGRALEPVSHAYTHFRVEATPVLVESGAAGAGRWVSPDGVAGLALAKLDHKILARLREQDSQEQA